MDTWEDLLRLIAVSRVSQFLTLSLMTVIGSFLVHPRTLPEVPSSHAVYETCLQIDFFSVHEALWMSATYSLEDLQADSTKTGLVELKIVCLWVGLALMKGASRGKGKHTQKQHDAKRWLMDWSNKAPTQ